MSDKNCDHIWNARHKSGFIVCDKCGKVYSEKLKSEGIFGQTLAYDVDCILLEIQEQQSDKLKEIE